VRRECLISSNTAAQLKTAAAEKKEARKLARLEEAACIAAVLAETREDAVSKKAMRSRHCCLLEALQLQQ
jgi:hypothetical protein